MIRSILVPLDGSAFGEQALPYALSVARRAQARVHLINVHTPAADDYVELQVHSETLSGQIRERSEAYLSRLAGELNSALQLDVSWSFHEGAIADTIRRQVEGHGIGLVALTTHARGAFGRFWLGSTADTLIRELRVPLLVIPPTHTPLPRLVDIPLGRILVPLDGTELAECILPSAFKLGRLFGASYTLLRVIEPLATVGMFPLGTPANFTEFGRAEAEDIEKQQDRLRQQAKNYLERIAAPLRREGVPLRTVVATDEQPAQAILDFAPLHVIAMATHGRRGLARFFRGSVADKVLRGSTVPLLVQRPG